MKQVNAVNPPVEIDGAFGFEGGYRFGAHPNSRHRQFLLISDELQKPVNGICTEFEV